MATITPDTNNVSPVFAVSSASARCIWLVSLLLRCPTILDRYANIGIVHIATRVSSHESMTIATSDAATTVTLDRMFTTVSVSTSCVLDTSLASLDCMSPVRLVEKNDSGCFSK